MTWAIVNNDTFEVVTLYSTTPDEKMEYPGDWGNPNLFTHVKVPDGYSSFKVTAQKNPETGVIEIIEDPGDAQIKNEMAWNELRMKRNTLLSKSDWTQLKDVDKPEWTTYRQSLRDLPANTTDPTNVTWPTPPT